ncbi:MAG: hypothetical protein WA087_01725 [Candidatus Saccharimonadales bacterium]
MQPKNVAIRKRTQIAMANRTMFFWVAGVSVLFGFAAVATIFLSQMMMFNEKVLSEKNKTIQILKDNNKNVTELELQIKAIDANQALIDSKADPDDRAIQVILDALPSEANLEALGASIQNKLLAGINNLSINSIQIDPVPGSESLGSNKSVVNASSSTSSGNEMVFRFSVTGDEVALKKVLNNLEKSIRTIDIISLKIEAQDEGTAIMSIQGRAFYEPVREVQLKDKTVK